MLFKRKFSFCCAALLGCWTLVLPAMADTVARANGRCSLKDDSYEAYNGYCTIKQKQNGGTTIFVVDLENGNRFRFSGPSRQQLHVETHAGIEQNVLFEDLGSKGVFTWNDGESTHRLAVKTDEVTNPNAQFDDHPSTSTGSAIAGAAVGALIGALLGGGSKPVHTSAGVEGQPVADLQSLIGSDPGFVESRLTAMGYTYIRSSQGENSNHSFWKRGGSCVDVRSTLNRYRSFTYTSSANCK